MMNTLSIIEASTDVNRRSICYYSSYVNYSRGRPYSPEKNVASYLTRLVTECS